MDPGSHCEALLAQVQTMRRGRIDSRQDAKNAKERKKKNGRSGYPSVVLDTSLGVLGVLARGSSDGSQIHRSRTLRRPLPVRRPHRARGARVRALLPRTSRGAQGDADPGTSQSAARATPGDGQRDGRIQGDPSSATHAALDASDEGFDVEEEKRELSGGQGIGGNRTVFIGMAFALVAAVAGLIAYAVQANSLSKVRDMERTARTA